MLVSRREPAPSPIPVILDTDIGYDIDDTFALAMLLKSPELDVKLVVSDSRNTEYEARIVAKLLETAGRTDIPIGVGIWQDDIEGRQAEWVRGYNLRRYPGRIWHDGVEVLIRTIRSSPQPITLICIGPLPNIRLALAKAPDIATKTRFVAMAGSIHLRHDGAPGAIPEGNVVADLMAARKVFKAPWREAVIAPLDTSGLVRFSRQQYDRLVDSPDPVMKAVTENYRLWCDFEGGQRYAYGNHLFYDTVAVHLAYSQDYLKMIPMMIQVDRSGYTLQTPSGQPFHVAVEWQDLSGYLEFLIQRLLSPVVSTR